MLSAAIWWWLAAGALVLAELFVGSFYMLMLALGCVAGALAAHGGVGYSMQMVVAAVVGAGTTAVWHYRRARAPRSAPVESNRDAGYRGSDWNVEFRGPGTPAPGPHVIVAVQGNRLIVAPVTN